MNRYRLGILCLAHGFVHGIMNIFPVVLEPIRQTFEWSLTSVSWIGTVGYVLFGFMALPGGWIADRFDRWAVLRTMVVGMGISLLGVGLWQTPVGFLISWCSTCLFAGLYHPLGLSSVVTSGGDRTGQAMGWHGFGGNIGFALMPMLAGILAAQFNWGTSFLFAGVVGLLLAVPYFFLTPRATVGESASSASSFPWSVGLVLVLLMYGLVGFVYRGMVTFIPSSFNLRLSADIGLGYVGGLTTTIYVIGAFGQLAGGWLEERFDSKILFGTVVGGYTTVLAVLIVSDGWLFFLLLLAWAFLYFAGQPILNTIVSRVGIRATHGRLYGAAFTMNLGLGATGAGVTGSLIDRGGLAMGYVGLLVSAILVLLTLWILTGVKFGGAGTD